ncbi:MAG: hypothetical protein JNL08_19720 [Planctomycetes bacterium]|nr:hypothetical protein [Planctomycetota bacterium]
MPTLRPLLSGFLLFAACSTSSVLEQSQHSARLGDHQRAYELLAAERQALIDAGDTPTPELEQACAAAWQRHLLERARYHIFGEREQAALDDLAELERIAPDYPELGALRDRAIFKLATRSVQAGEDQLLRKDLQGALTAFLRAEALLPGFLPAVKGTERVRTSLGELSTKAQRQFLEAVRKLPEFRFVEVRWHSDIAVANAPEREDADQLRIRARHEMALAALERARECVRANQFGAALLELREAAKLDPELPGVAEEIAAVERETKASLLMEKAQIAMRSGQFDGARQQLDEAYAMSTLLRGDISELMIQNRRREGDAKYQAARDLEILGKKAEALAAFEALALEWPEGLADERARVDGLKLDIEQAQKEWDAAVAADQAGDLPGALLHYEAAMQFYPGWQDGPARIERLKQAIAQQADGSGAEGGARRD